jgi:serine O-acetyltransferase
LGAGIPVTRPANPPILSALKADAAELAKVKGGGRGGVSGLLDVLTIPGFWVVALWRVGNALHERRLRPLSRLTYVANMVLFGADLPAGAVVGPGLVVPHPVGLAVASDVVIGKRCRLMGGVAIGGSGKAGRSGHPVIGDDVWFLRGSAAFGPIRIDDKVVVGAGAIVSQDIPAEMLVLVAKTAVELRIRPRNDLDPDDEAPSAGVVTDLVQEAGVLLPDEADRAS